MMKTIIILLTLMCNACYGQEIDSLHLSQDSFWSKYVLKGHYVDSMLVKNDTAYYYGSKKGIAFIIDKFCISKLLEHTIIDTNSGAIYSRQEKAKRDTVPVTLMVIDTNTGVNSTAYFFHPLDQALNERRIPYWIKGYSVRELHNTGEGANPIFGNELFDDYWQHIFYLDAEKKPLKNNIIVWQSVAIE